MKLRLVLTITTSLLTGCHQVQQPELAATIIDLTLPGPTVFCACCAGYRVQIGSKSYYTNTVPVEFDKPNTPVWIRYQADTGLCKGIPGRIEIVSIRSK